MTRSSSLLFLLAISLAAPALVRAQSCCSPATTPSGAVAHAGLKGGNFQFGLYAESFELSGGRRGTESFDFPGDREANAQAIALTGRYGISDRITASILLPFNRRERSDLTQDGTRVSRSYTGLSDVAVLGYYRITKPLSRTEWTAGGGVKFATGESRAEDDTGELPQELQPGTGANDILLTTIVNHGFGGGSWTASASATWRITGTLEKIDEFPATGEEVVREFQFGNELIYGLGAFWTPDYQWGFGLGIIGRHAQPDRGTQLNPDGTTGGVEELPSTGGERIWLHPAIRFAPAAGKLGVSAGVLFPIYENLLGSQLSSNPGFRFTFEGGW